MAPRPPRTVQESPRRRTGLLAFDETAVVTMSYTPSGSFKGADLQPHAHDWLTHRDTALQHAVPFAEWWERYGEETPCVPGR